MVDGYKVIDFDCVLFELWDCGDDHCGCRQPRIVRVRTIGRGFGRRFEYDVIWEGLYASEGQYRLDESEEAIREGEYLMMRRIAAEAARAGVRVECWIPDRLACEL